MAAWGLHVHYFIALLLIELHLWFTLDLRWHQAVAGRLLLVEVVVALLFLPQAGQALSCTRA